MINSYAASTETHDAGRRQNQYGDTQQFGVWGNSTGGVDGCGNTLPVTALDSFGYNGQCGYHTDRAGTGDTGFILCTHRYYDPTLARWLTEDPIGEAGGMNLYGYCEGNPVMGFDIDGKDTISIDSRIQRKYWFGYYQIHMTTDTLGKTGGLMTLGANNTRITVIDANNFNINGFKPGDVVEFQKGGYVLVQRFLKW